MTDSRPRSVCVVGSGPSGLYAADHIARKRPDCRIDVLDRLPTPFGLVRAGVAPDHQGTKNIVRQFERGFAKPTQRFLGHVAVGSDISAAELADLYDAVIYATGAPLDRPLGIPGDTLPEVYGSAAFVGWYNGHPDHAGLSPRLGRRIAIVGNGNVALDVARILAKTRSEMAGADLCAHAQDAIDAAPITDLYLIGRRGPLEASFTPPELGELGHLERACPILDPAALSGLSAEAVTDPKEQKVKEKNLEILTGFTTGPTDKPIRIHLLFLAAPKEVLGTDGAVSGMRLERTRLVDGRAEPTGETFDINADTVISAIGYRCIPPEGVPADSRAGIIANTDGVVSPGTFVVGWAKRGPSGVIPSNRSDSIGVADQVLTWLDQCPDGKAGPEGLDALLTSRGVTPVNFTGWQKINAAEIAQAPDGKPREKLISIDAMLATARG